ncbi:MAG: hypothetical protein F4Y69_10930 [Chloroflexi bacterium]|nr:hypothetical protein [Chloroflexota bacterium]MXX81523.1 hypothetical protein [Chloroflexota bacterium]MYB23220.1 hypothetical protein [Chloroflexota bacterium]MYD16328.1 hypothetical protein [Chloroflexota bacterium]MYF22591.1 hypothetical protein [Chloroflexota bacterium]
MTTETSESTPLVELGDADEAAAERLLERPQAVDEPLAPRTVFLHRRVVTITPDRIEVRPPRSAVVVPLVGVALTAGLLALLGTSVDSFPFWLMGILLLFAVVLLPLSGISLVYALLGANIVADRRGQNVSMKQRFLGLGIGTNELIPVWKIREFLVEDEGREIARAGGALPAEEIAQWQLVLVKKSGTRHVLGTVSTPRQHEEEGLQQIFEVAEAFSALTEAPIRGPIW